MDVFYLEYCCLRMPHQNYFTQRGLYQIVASCLQCYPTCSTFCSSTVWLLNGLIVLNSLIVLHKPAISLSLSGAELFATDSQLTCQEIASRSKPISSQAPTTQLPRYFSSQLDYFQTCLWERACKILQRECAVPISRSDRRCHCIEPFLSPPSLSTRVLHLPDAQE
jgi:hypothetical protein